MRHLLLAVIILATSCRQPTGSVSQYPYTLNDFPDSLRPYLFTIINEGYIGEKTYPARDSLSKKTSDADLVKLTRCEHPLIRSVALNILTCRDHIDHYSVLMDHLDDTAHVSWYFQ